MVCQAAGQTRFRALKYENGIAGSAVIVVRVIACFQPLQDCQAEYFRHLLKPHSTSGDCFGWMGEGCGSWFPQQQFDWQSHNLNSLAVPHPLGQQRTNTEFMNFDTNMVSTTRTLPVYANTESLHFQVGQDNEKRGWFYCLPHFQQVYMPGSNSILKAQLPVNPYENQMENLTPKAGSECAQKRFLVFDQSGGQTVVFSSAFGTPIKCPTSLVPKFPCHFNWNDPIPKVKPSVHSEPISIDAFEDNGTDVQSEMHEDTEELNALLYSDDDNDDTDIEYDDDDDEVVSTGHSPSTMTAHYEQLVGATEDFARTTGLTKKRKLLDVGNDYVPLLMSPAVPANPIRHSEYEDDADSSCVNGRKPVSCDVYSSSGSKRMKEDKIRDTVSVLRSIIPDGEGKDAIVVLDEAIDYLKSLKLKAKSMGFSTA
ncbi:hypothetical protein V6N13_026031 [Hibiscus sabdariffa]|uniref:BHLH domain-containing protein n=1 Tax=Hibiscus sabdariffa TaxID=183260 RepID=A0ABR1ZCH6_9ROSI